MKIVKKVISFSVPLAMVASQAATAFAAPAATIAPVSFEQAGFRITDFSALIQGLLNMVLFIAALLVFGYLIWGGITWITSGGDKGKTEEARNKITAAIIGLAVVASAYAIFRLVIAFLGINDPFSGFSIQPAYK